LTERGTKGKVFFRRLEELFRPRSVAVVGASDDFGKLGYHVMKSLLEGDFGGRVYPVNPRAREIWGLRAYPSVGELPEGVDLAVVAIPAPLVPEVIEACGRKGVKGVVLITAGFREVEDPRGEELHRKVSEIASRWALPIIGPNTFGFVNRTVGVNASFTPEFSLIRPGGIALVSQSGGFCHLSGFMAIEEGVGLSKLVGIGNRLNVDFPEMVRLLAQDPEARVIALYIEGMERPRELVEAAQEVRGQKSILAYKAGRSEKGDSASRFHTGALAGDYRIWRGALRQAGILEVQSAEELLDAAKALEALPPLEGPRIAVLSSQAGPGLIAADKVEAEGLRLARFSASTHRRIDELLPPLAMRTNPVDMGPAWYNPRAILGILEAVLKDEATDGVLFLNMFASANLKLATEVRDYLKGRETLGKPVIGCFSAPPGLWKEVQEVDQRKGFVILPTPERAARAMGDLWRWHRVRRRWLKGG